MHAHALARAGCLHKAVSLLLLPHTPQPACHDCPVGARMRGTPVTAAAAVNPPAAAAGCGRKPRPTRHKHWATAMLLTFGGSWLCTRVRSWVHPLGILTSPAVAPRAHQLAAPRQRGLQALSVLSTQRNQLRLLRRRGAAVVLPSCHPVPRLPLHPSGGESSAAGVHAHCQGCQRSAGLRQDGAKASTSPTGTVCLFCRRVAALPSRRAAASTHSPQS